MQSSSVEMLEYIAFGLRHSCLGLCWFFMYLNTDFVVGNYCRVSRYGTLVTPTWTHLVLVFPQHFSGMVLNLFSDNCPHTVEIRTSLAKMQGS